MSFAVRKIDDPMMPLTSSNTESSRPSPRTSVGFAFGDERSGEDAGPTAGSEWDGFHYPIPSSSEDSSGVPQRRQITAEQSPQVRGSVTSCAQFGQ